ncbi:MAG: hypothetical protein JWR16_1374 [Nevskia sp.]|nr:hypothetical protein [Nevskia sp.]
MANIVELYQRLANKPLGKRLFSRAVVWRAPYFGTIKPQIRELRAGCCEVFMRNRHAVHNHIGTVHAIAMCNLCEIAGGLLIDATLKRELRWIPRGMTVRYLKKADTDLTAVADWVDNLASDFQGDVVMHIPVQNTAGETVMTADISMYVSPRK